jgi:glycolate oxidase
MTFEAELAGFLPADCLLLEAEAKRPYECDGLSAYRQIPRVVCLPRTREQVRQVLETCARHHVPVVPRGAGTGLAGGALPLAEGCVLSLARFNRILEIDPENRLAVVEPGVRNLAISEAVAVHGLYYAPDPSSQIACSIGGNVAENSGGVHCLKYGLTVHNVLGVKLFLSDGTWLELGGRTLESPGLDLLAVINGSEGLLGVVMEVTVRLQPRPPVAQVLMAAFDSTEAAGRAVGAIIEAGIIPAGLEMMDAVAIRVAEDFCHAGYPTDAAAILLCEVDGSVGEVVADGARVESVLAACGAREVRRSASEAERLRFWQGRKAAFPAFGRITPDYFCMDGTIPRRELPGVLRRIAEISEQSGLVIANVFHAGDGNLHPLIGFDANDDAELALAEEVGAQILRLCVEVGGTVTGEHGVGVEKLNQMCVQFSTAELTCFHAVKAAFDRAGLLNPGRAVPTLHRCAEFGAMRVSRGQMSHPELPRF